MNNSFDKRLPITTSYRIEKEIFFIKHTSFSISLEEGRAIQELVLYALKDSRTVGLVIDNREANGAWPQNLLDDNNDAEANISKFNKRIATLTNSAITTMQMNRVARSTSTEAWAKAFNCDFNSDVENFIKGK